MITINNDIQEESCFLYGPDDELIGEIKNELAFYDVRSQIADQKLEGYSILLKNKRYGIDSDGRVQDYPPDLFPKTLEYLSKL